MQVYFRDKIQYLYSISALKILRVTSVELMWTSKFKRGLWSSKAPFRPYISSYFFSVYSHRVAELGGTYPQSRCWVVAFRNAAEEHEGAWVWSGISHGPGFALCRRSLLLPRKKQVVGGLGQGMSVDVRRADGLTSTNLMLILSSAAGRSSSHQTRERRRRKWRWWQREKEQASSCWLLRQCVHVMPVKKNEGILGGIFTIKTGLWQAWRVGQVSSAHPSRLQSAQTVYIHSACFSNTWQWAGVAALFAIPSTHHLVRGTGLWTSWVLPVHAQCFAFAVLSLHKAGEKVADYQQRLSDD